MERKLPTSVKEQQPVTREKTAESCKRINEVILSPKNEEVSL